MIPLPVLILLINWYGWFIGITVTSGLLLVQAKVTGFALGGIVLDGSEENWESMN